MKNILRVLIELPLYFISGFFPRKENRIVFGTWNGEKYADNSKYMFQHLAGKSGYQLIWCGNPEIQDQVPKGENIIFVENGSLRSWYYILTSKFAFITHSQNDICKYNILRNAEIIQQWHGIGIKRLGIAKPVKKNILAKYRVKIQGILRRYDFFICSSEENKKRNLKAFKQYGINDDNVLNSGQPRNDLFFNYKAEDVRRIKEKHFEKYNIPKGKKVITYMPTFRKDKSKQFLFSKMNKEDYNALEKVLKKHNAILLEKVHHQDTEGNIVEDRDSEYIYNIGNYTDIDTQELLLNTDMLITDYSSCFIDYVLLDRPIIHFAYDYQQYVNEDQGLYYDLYDIAGGDIIKDIGNLITGIDLNFTNVDHGLHMREHTRSKMTEYEDGRSCEKIIKELNI